MNINIEADSDILHHGGDLYHQHNYQNDVTHIDKDKTEHESDRIMMYTLTH